MEDTYLWVDVMSYARYMCHIAVNIYSPHYNMSLLYHHCGCCTVCVFFVLKHEGMERLSFVPWQHRNSMLKNRTVPCIAQTALLSVPVKT